MNIFRKLNFKQYFGLTLALIFVTLFFQSCSETDLIPTTTIGLPVAWITVHAPSNPAGGIFHPVWLAIDLAFFVLIYLLYKKKVETNWRVSSFFNIALWVTILTSVLVSPLNQFIPWLGLATMYVIVLPVMGLYDLFGLPHDGISGTNMDAGVRIIYVLYILLFWGLNMLARKQREKHLPKKSDSLTY